MRQLDRMDPSRQTRRREDSAPWSIWLVCDVLGRPLEQLEYVIY